MLKLEIMVHIVLISIYLIYIISDVNKHSCLNDNLSKTK